MPLSVDIALLCRSAIEPEGFENILLHAKAGFVEQTQPILCLCVFLIGGDAIPFCGFGGIVFDLFIMVAHLRISFGAALCCRFLVPTQGFIIILLYTDAPAVHTAQTALPGRIVLVGSHAVPLQGFIGILRYSLAKEIDIAQTALRLGVPFFRRLTEPFDGFGIILFRSVAFVKGFTLQIKRLCVCSFRFR